MLIDATGAAAGPALRLQGGLRLELADPEAARSQALEAAIGATRRKAETAARAAGVTLGAVRTVTEGIPGSSRPMFQAMPAARPAGPPIGAANRTAG